MNKIESECAIWRDGRFPAVSFLVFVVGLALWGAGVLPVAAQDAVPPPAEPPDGENGLIIYQARCANCHGTAGEGDGELAANLPMPPAAFTDPEFRRAGDPADYFTLITNGNLDSGMPPFGPSSSNPLSEAERWDAIAAVYSISTPADAIAQGEEVYADACAACHGESGTGDGPTAADFDEPLPDLTSPAYWFTRSNQTVFTVLGSEDVPGHDYELSEDELWAVVDYGRSLSYNYADAEVLSAPIEAATISGVVTNGTTEEIVTDASAQLRGFTQDIQEALTLTTTVGTDGRYAFDLSDVPPDLVYLVSVEYEGLSFSSDVAELSRGNATLDLPVTVYEQTNDPEAVRIDQVHFVFEFTGEQVQVSELYVFNNQETAVYVGESGDPDQGTVKFSLPPEAENVSFQRAFQGVESFVPATEVIETEEGWADTVPLRPGRSNTSLVAVYTLPYDDGLTFSHDLHYNARNVSVILPDAGVELEGERWTSQGSQEAMGGAFLSYARQDVPAGETLSLTLSGEPTQVTSSGGAGSSAAPRDENIELIIGGIALIVVLGAGVYVYRTRQLQAEADDYVYEDEYEYDDEYDYEEDVQLADDTEVDQLLQEIADLDEAYDAGEVEEEEYRAERQRLKEELKSLW